jgi:hypothetical protein
LLAFDPSQLRFGNIPPAFIVFAWISILLFLSDNHRLPLSAGTPPNCARASEWAMLNVPRQWQPTDVWEK